MPRRQTTGDTLLSVEQTMELLNFTEEEVLRLVELKAPHTMFKINGIDTPKFGRKEILGVVTPRPAHELKTVPEEKIPDEEDEPTETVRPDPPAIPSMSDKKGDQGEAPVVKDSKKAPVKPKKPAKKETK